MIARPDRTVSPLVWLGAPMAASLAASLIFALPLRVAGLQAPEPVFALVPAFAWALARPSILAPFLLIILGGLLDLLWGGPLGVWPLCLLSAYTLAFAGRRILVGQDFLAMWVSYAAACAAAMVVGSALVSVKAGRIPDLVGVALQFAVSAALFPFAWRLIERYEVADTRFR